VCGVGTDLVDRVNGETEQHPIAARARPVREQTARDTGWNASGGKVNSVGSNCYGDVEAIVHDEKRATSGGCFPQSSCDLEELSAATTAGAQLHDDLTGGACGVDGVDDALG